MSNSNYLLSFLEDLNKTIADTAKKMEEILFNDPQGALFRGRLLAEEIVKDVFIKEEYDQYQFPSNFEKINHLSKEGILTREVQQALDTIRITGNKAVHNAKYEDLTEALRVYKKTYLLARWYAEVYSTSNILIPDYVDPRPKVEFSKDDINNMVQEALKNHKSEPNDLETTNGDNFSSEEQSAEESHIMNTTIEPGKSYLLRELKRLQDSAQEAVENANSFSKFKDYMHVKRKIQLDFESVLERAQTSAGPQLILLCGSVGDGKSHLLAYIKEKKPQLLEGFQILNDATESFSPNMNAMETLSELLDGFSDDKISYSNDKVVLAINLGVLHNFISEDHNGKTFNNLRAFVEKSELFTQNITTKYSKDHYHIVGFSDYHAYELTEHGPISDFFGSIIKKVFSEDENNPFYAAYKEDKKNDLNLIIHENYKFMMNPEVQETVIQLVIQSIVKNKLVISARAFYNFIADIIIPDQYSETMDRELEDFDKINNIVPSLLFDRKERSFILKTMVELDPINIRNKEIDQIIIDINTVTEWGDLLNKNTKSDDMVIHWLLPLSRIPEHTPFMIEIFTKTLIRLTYLVNQKFAKNATSESYKRYMKHLYFFNKGVKQQIKPFYDEVKSSIFKWKGSPKRHYIYMNKPTEKFRIAQYLELKPSINHINTNPEETLKSFKQSLSIAFHGGNINDYTMVDIDYVLYDLLTQVQEGYCPNKKDEEDAIKFVEFIDKLMRYGKRKEELLIHIPSEQKIYKLGLNDFEDGLKFEKE
ncbi:DNA phosphorothioation-dependent restriction protein DptF [Alkalihalophilus pseudofirmus]|uniref:DNA phosphorothioation-dependent restriction protein DptF n=1 Tax=Alkalihalophilus pseudofirmus TaxID=79885 RepID=A0AAJ2NKL6_ALKPS|nr:DNA phosphorothioation-dependent restriction protein DptF [Alkalihalophilus pseudofirmus]MDV2884692.1 DNA phosphorothioation-dependent restriction protein DptF [Alkalihalophilus pseudofirmus]